MLIKIDSIEMRGFGIFRKKLNLDFVGKPIIGILAEYAENSTRSNRSGKTLLIEAIKYNLVGTTRAKKEVDLIHKGMESMYVKCVYSDSTGKTYTIKRGRELNGSGMLELDWVEKSRESQKAITDIFGVSAEDFELTNFFKQSDINGFMDLSPSEKTKYLMKWVDNNHWEEINNSIKEDLKNYKLKLRENEAVRKSLSEAVIMPEEINAEIDMLLARSSSLDKAISKIEKLEANARNNYEDLKSESDKIEAELTILDKELKVLNRDISQRPSIEKDIKKCNEVVLQSKNSLKGLDTDLDSTQLRIELSKETEKLKQLNRTKTALKNAVGICPVLGTECKDIKVSSSDNDKFNEDIENAEYNIDSIKDDIKIVNKIESLDSVIRDEEKTLDRLELELDSIPSKSDIDKLSLKIEKLEHKINYDALDELKNEISDLVAEKREKSISKNTNDRTISGLEQKVKTANETIEKMQHLEAINAKLGSAIEDLNYLNRATGKNGIPSEEIENAFGEVQDDINMLLKYTDGSRTVSFSPDKELGTWEAFCSCGFKFPKGFRGSECTACGAERAKKRKEEISLKVIEDGIESDFNLDSGGGRAIISFCVRIALTMLKRRQNKSRLNILFFDEVDSALDGFYWNSIINTITTVIIKQLGYDQIFMISHKDEIKNAIPDIIKVVRYSDNSVASFI